MGCLLSLHNGDLVGRSKFLLDVEWVRVSELDQRGKGASTEGGYTVACC